MYALQVGFWQLAVIIAVVLVILVATRIMRDKR